ncbi:MAG: right-handed parallel beta-helix repeat-containing protein [Planctomycetia bacterium]|nr:right-handed parallel beta-helix repeat-containing protein [Planctomycetia bacterium]
MVFLGGGGGTVLDRVHLVPGPPPPGADRPRLCCTNADGTHFNSVVRGPTITDCVYRLTADDPVNVHGNYCYVVERLGPRTLALSPRSDLGLEAGDTIDAFDGETCASKGRAVVVEKKVRSSAGLEAAIETVWRRKSPATVKLVYEVTLDRDLDCSVGDAVSSRTRTGAGIVIQNSSFHGGGRVMVKAPDALIENNTFSRTNAAAIHVGSDIGYWSESSFAENVTIRGNQFRGCGMAANHFFAESEVFATVYVGCTHPLEAPGLLPTFENRNILIEGNTIDDSYSAALQITNADGVLVRGNTIGPAFLRGSAFAAGKKFGIVPDAAVIIAMARNVSLVDNSIATGPVARRPVSIHSSCDASVRVVQPEPAGKQ